MLQPLYPLGKDHFDTHLLGDREAQRKIIVSALYQTQVTLSRVNLFNLLSSQELVCCGCITDQCAFVP